MYLNSKEFRVKPTLDKFYVYALCKPCGTPFYIGKGINGRINHHFTQSKLSHDSLKNLYIKQYGDKVRREILCYFDTEERAFSHEEWLISYYGTLNNGGILTNISTKNHNMSTEERRAAIEFDPIHWQTETTHSFNDLEQAFLFLQDGKRDCVDVSKITNISATHLASLFFRRDSRVFEVNLIFEKHGVDKLVYETIPKPRKTNVSVEAIKHYHKLWLEAEMSIGDIANILGYSHDNVNRIFLGKQMVGVIDSSLKPVARKTAVSTSQCKEILTLKHVEGLSYRRISERLGITSSTIRRVCQLKGCNSRFESFVNNIIRNKND